MRCLSKVAILMVLHSLCFVALAQGPTYKLGRKPTEQEIKAWDIAISPDGKELPPGRGTAKEGAQLYAERCAACHGPTGEQDSPGGRTRLVGGKGSLTTIHEVRTVGSFWPYATTVWDYIHRAMPPDQGGSLTPNQVYALTAFILYRNDIIRENDVMDAKSLPKVQMPNRNGFDPPQPRQWRPGVPRQFGLYP